MIGAVNMATKNTYLILSCITVSLKALDIVDSLPNVEFDD